MSKWLLGVVFFLVGMTQVTNADDDCFNYLPADSCNSAYGSWGPGGSTLCGNCSEESNEWYCDTNWAFKYVMDPATDPGWWADRKTGGPSESGFSGILQVNWIDCAILTSCAPTCYYSEEWDDYYCDTTFDEYLELEEDILGPFECPLVGSLPN